ncbi:hypothetical protein J2Y00_003565 [Deinococcus soli (ex Cha et al. 2016)]|uniref:CRISPR-associated protein n=2 Tax=Deinococcus soli (ex Cha et al. 2016) TaxID=1309411 RepID=A0AAE3XGA4_9DEIO|nr:hypothetical protein [Deinococcus soli (ex Cha et al. 2016)]
MLTVPAADAILSAVYWHPGMSYEITQIWVLNPVQIYTWHGSELKDLPTKNGTDVTSNRTPRSKRLIHNPAYLIEARLVLRPEVRGSASHWAGKHFGILQRRLARGQVHEQPYFGQREYVCNIDVPNGDERPWAADADLGPIPLHIQEIPDPRGPLNCTRHRYERDQWVAETYRGRAEPSFFHGLVRGGILHVPPYREQA